MLQAVISVTIVLSSRQFEHPTGTWRYSKGNESHSRASHDGEVCQASGGSKHNGVIERIFKRVDDVRNMVQNSASTLDYNLFLIGSIMYDGFAAT
jgi:hypothetical protein